MQCPLRNLSVSFPPSSGSHFISLVCVCGCATAKSHQRRLSEQLSHYHRHRKFKDKRWVIKGTDLSVTFFVLHRKQGECSLLLMSFTRNLFSFFTTLFHHSNPSQPSISSLLSSLRVSATIVKIHVVTFFTFVLFSALIVKIKGSNTEISEWFCAQEKVLLVRTCEHYGCKTESSPWIWYTKSIKVSMFECECVQCENTRDAKTIVHIVKTSVFLVKMNCTKLKFQHKVRTSKHYCLK